MDSQSMFEAECLGPEGPNAPLAPLPSELVCSLTRRVADLEAQLSTAEAALRHSSRLAIVGQLTAGLIHEINNPICSIVNAVYLLTSMSHGDRRYPEVVELLDSEAARVAAMVRRMHRFYRYDSDERRACDLGHLLHEMLQMAALRPNARNIDFEEAPLAAPVVVHASEIQLRQLFLNLLLNAVDAMPNRGKLTVRVIPTAAAVIVEVEDTGQGIPPEIRARLFEPFVTSKSSGTGLGLYISAQIVAHHRGRIEVESTPGHGSLFRITLPSLPAYEPPMPQPTEPAATHT